MNRQANVLTYMDCFRVLMWVSATLSPIALFFAVMLSLQNAALATLQQRHRSNETNGGAIYGSLCHSFSLKTPNS